MSRKIDFQKVKLRDMYLWNLKNMFKLVLWVPMMILMINQPTSTAFLLFTWKIFFGQKFPKMDTVIGWKVEGHWFRRFLWKCSQIENNYTLRNWAAFSTYIDSRSYIIYSRYFWQKSFANSCCHGRVDQNRQI